jgi:hypothetical protein
MTWKQNYITNVWYHGETQDEEFEFTSNVDNTIKDVELENVPSSIIPPITQVYQPHSMARPKQIRSGWVYRCCQLGEYQLICDSTKYYDDVIKEWMNSKDVLQVNKAIKWEP